MGTDGVLQQLEDLLPAIRERREEIEQGRRLPRDLVDGLSATGVFTLGVPRAVGGEEADPIDIMRAIETVASGDGSAGWCTMIGLSGNLAGGYMNESGAKEILTGHRGPSAAGAGPIGAAVRVDGGVRVSGHWPFGSGITHSDWVWAGSFVMENGQPRMTPKGPEIIHTWIPVRDVEIHDTWYVSGLCGTGSNDYSASDVFVPEQRTFSLFDPSGHRPEPLYQIPVVSLFVSQLASVALGIARGALDELTEQAQTKVPTMSQVPLADKPLAQIELARAEAALGAARAFLHATIAGLRDTARAGDAPTMRQRALSRAAAINAVETGAAVAATAATLGGGSALYSSSSLQRHARDAEAIKHHFTVAPHNWEEAGRVLMGRAPTVPIF